MLETIKRIAAGAAAGLMVVTGVTGAIIKNRDDKVYEKLQSITYFDDIEVEDNIVVACNEVPLTKDNIEIKGDNVRIVYAAHDHKQLYTHIYDDIPVDYVLNNDLTDLQDDIWYD